MVNCKDCGRPVEDWLLRYKELCTECYNKRKAKGEFK
jgi:NMD protein affecting ribosome stability and mRNA decay